jgi:DNA polymerase-4
VGKATAKELEALGVTTIGQLQRVAPAVLAARLGPHGPDLLDLAFGRDDRAVEPFSPPKSMGAENTFGHDCRDPAVLEETLRGQAERVARELRAERLAACRVTPAALGRLPHANAQPTGDPTQDGLEVYRRATTLLRARSWCRPCASSGSRSRPSPPGSRAAAAAGSAAVRREQLARAVDRITSRFGRSAIVPARLLGRDEE